MAKLKANLTSEIWNGKKNRALGIKGEITAKIEFGSEKEECDRCINLQKNVVVKIYNKGTYNSFDDQGLSLCVSCLANLIQGVNEALQQFKLAHVVLTGKPVGEAIEEVKAMTSPTAIDMQNALDILDQHLERDIYKKDEKEIISDEVADGMKSIPAFKGIPIPKSNIKTNIKVKLKSKPKSFSYLVDDYNDYVKDFNEDQF